MERKRETKVKYSYLRVIFSSICSRYTLRAKSNNTRTGKLVKAVNARSRVAMKETSAPVRSSDLQMYKLHLLRDKQIEKEQRRERKEKRGKTALAITVPGIHY